MKTKKWKALFVLAALVTLATVINCGGGSSSTPETGFKAKGEQYVATFNGYAFYGGTSIQGSWYFDNGPTTGTTTFFQAFTSSGYYHVANGRVPARWGIAVPTGCIQYLDPFFRDVTVGSNQVSRCVIAFAGLTADPSSIDLANPPPTVTFAGGGFDATYGMPVIEYYDQYSGEMVASTTAFSVAGDGSTTVAYTPSLYGVYSGSYNIFVSNKASDGSNTMVGVATFSACCIDPGPSEPPPDPPECGGNQVCYMQ